MLRTVIISLSTSLLLGCQPMHKGETNPAVEPVSSSVLAGSDWAIQSIAGRPVMVSTPLSVHFEAQGKLSGFAGCNRFMGRYELSGTKLTIGPLATTRKLCAGPAMSQEQLLLLALGKPLEVRHNPSKSGVISLISEENEQTLLVLK